MTVNDDPIRFLLVDDLDENLLALTALLKRDGLAFDLARSGDDALELMLVNDYALALLDVQMPGMDGFELAEIMRANERSRHIPIIFVTAGSGDVARRFRGYEAGAVDFIQKPIEAEVLRSKANVFFALYEQRREIATQRDELAALSAALQVADVQKNRFLAVLGHELRNPLMALSAGLNLLEKQTTRISPEEIRSSMRRGITHVTRLIDDLLDIARIEQGKISLIKGEVHLQEIVTFAVQTIRSVIDETRHVVFVDMPPDPIMLFADQARLIQVLSNLIGNAVKFTPAGGEIRIGVYREENWAVIVVTDEGIGIDPREQSRIFEIFEQVERDRGGQQEGLGIGLALVKQLAELHGGSITLRDSALDEGSTFEVRIPTS
jgi:signal transduction histidine kinase